MADIVMMPRDHWVDACDAVRNRGRSSSLLKSGELAGAILDIPAGGDVPTDTINISANGQYDVTNYGSANVAVPNNEIMGVVRNVTISTQPPNGAFTNILTEDEFVKKHYADDSFSAMLMHITQPAKTTNYVYGIYHGNMNLGTAAAARYGFAFVVNSSGTFTQEVASAKINAGNWNVNLRAYDTGNLAVYLKGSYILPAGQYRLIMSCPGH